MWKWKVAGVVCLVVVVVGVVVHFAISALQRASLAAIEANLDQYLELRERMGRLRVQGDLPGAIRAAEAAVSLGRTFDPTPDASMLGNLEALSVLRFENGEIEAAIQTGREALDLRVKLYGADHWETIDAKWRLQKFERFRSCPEAERREILQADSVVRDALSSGDVGRYSEAIETAKIAVALHRRILGDEHPDTADRLQNLAYLWHFLRDAMEAERLLLEALAIRRNAQGEEHPATANVHEDLGLIYISLKDTARAESHLQKCLAIRREVVGENDPRTVECLDRLGYLYESMGDYGQAKRYREESLMIRMRTFPDDHPDTARSLHNLAKLCGKIGETEEAMLLAKQALAIRINVLGEEHCDTSETRNLVDSLSSVEAK